MHGRFDSRHPLVGLSDELIRLNGRMKSVFAPARRAARLGDSELSVLNAVVEAERPPTVPQIGRSFGQPRQLVQRAANALVAAGLIETAPNPDHKRALLLVPTQGGVALKRDLDARADAIAGSLGAAIDERTVRATTEALRTLRKSLEAQVRARVGE